MKIPRAEPQASISGGIPTPYADSRAGIAPWATLERGAARLITEQEEVEERILAAKRRTDATGIMLELGAVLDEEAAKVNDQDPAADQAARFAQFGQEWLKQRAKSITDPLLAESILAGGTEAVALGAGGVRAEARRRILETTQLRTKEQIGVLVSKGNLDEASAMIRDQTSAGVFSGEAGARELESARVGAINTVVAQLSEQSDEVALQAAQDRSGVLKSLKDDERKKLVDTLTNRIQARMKVDEEVSADTQKAALDEVTQLEKAMESAHGRNEVELLGHFLENPDANPSLVVQWAKAGRIKAGREAVMGLVSALKDIKAQANNYDDPVAITEVDYRLYQPAGPAITAGQLLELRAQRRISDTSFRRGMAVLSEHGKFAMTQGGQERVASYASAKATIETWFTTVGEVFKGDKQDIVVLKGKALDDLWRMTKGGRPDGVDPVEALPVIMQQYRSVGADVAKTFLKQVPLAYRNQAGIPDGTKLKQEYLAGRVLDADYRRYRSYILWAADIVPMAEWPAMLNPPVLSPTPGAYKPGATPAPAPGGGRKAKE